MGTGASILTSAKPARPLELLGWLRELARSTKNKDCQWKAMYMFVSIRNKVVSLTTALKNDPLNKTAPPSTISLSPTMISVGWHLRARRNSSTYLAQLAKIAIFNTFISCHAKMWASSPVHPFSLTTLSPIAHKTPTAMPQSSQYPNQFWN